MAHCNQLRTSSIVEMVLIQMTSIANRVSVARNVDALLPDEDMALGLLGSMALTMVVPEGSHRFNGHIVQGKVVP